MKDLIRIEAKPALLSVNFAELEKHLAKELEKYDVVVTGDTVKDAKALATELNATKKIIDTRRKDEVAKASEPVKQFDANMKKLVAMCEAGRQKILDQVQRFEDETRAKALELLTEYRVERWTDLAVNDEFRRAQINDLAILSAVTGKGALAASARRSVDERVMADKSMHDRTERRLLLLENQSLKAGLASPLTRDHVNSFLFEPEEVYQAQLDRIIESEVKRQEEAEQKLREKIQRENVAAAEKQVQETISQAKEVGVIDRDLLDEASQTAADLASSIISKEPDQSDTAQTQSSRSCGESNTVTCFIVCSFELQVDPRAPEEVIRKKFMAKMEAAGFQSLVSVRVNKQQAAA